MRIRDLLRQSDETFKRNLFLFILSYFIIILNYSLVRAASTTFFFEAQGAKSSPLAWFWGVFFLSISVWACNRFQAKHSVQKLFLGASIISSLLLLIGTVGHLQGHKIFSYLPFIWKEIYIVVQVHLLLAYANAYFEKDVFKILIGPN